MPAETNFEAVDGDTRQRVRERLGELLLHDPNNLGQYSLLSLSILAVAESPVGRQEAWKWFQDYVVKDIGKFSSLQSQCEELAEKLLANTFSLAEGNRTCDQKADSGRKLSLPMLGVAPNALREFFDRRTAWANERLTALRQLQTRLPASRNIPGHENIIGALDEFSLHRNQSRIRLGALSAELNQLLGIPVI